jgi:hypothetical protein
MLVGARGVLIEVRGAGAVGQKGLLVIHPVPLSIK